MSANWEVRFSNSRKLPYFYNVDTQESVWSPPAGLTQEQMYALPGAQQYLTAQGGEGGGEKGGGGGGPPGQVKASHLLVKHAGSRRPASWKNPNITLPKEEAQRQIQSHIDALSSVPAQDLPRAFAELASQHSDCSSHTKGGDLGWFGRKQMQKPFEDATYNLEVGQLSGPIDTDSGTHVILRTG